MMTRQLTMTRASLTLLAATSVVLAGTVATAPQASAAGRDGHCNKGEFCYYFNSNQKGSVSDFKGSVSNYGTHQPTCYEFKGKGRGRHKCIKNHAASVWNRSGKKVRVYYNTGYQGPYQTIPAHSKRNLRPKLKNDNASHRFLGGLGSCHTDGTNTKLPSSILVYRVGQGRVVRVGFKKYVKNVLPNEWKAGWPKQSLRAGAMAVKTFGWWWALHSTKKTSWGQCYDVTDNTDSQVYRPGSAVPRTNRAVNDTWGVRMSRGGDIFVSHYCSTETACGAWVDGQWMSQYGSAAMARHGKGYRKILHHYYRNIRIH